MLSSRLGDELERQGKSQAALAKAVGVSAATVSQWRAGTKTPSSANVEKIARFLSVPAAWLQYGGDGDATPQRRASEKERTDYKRECVWYHRPAPQDEGRELGNAAEFAFPGGLETLARETAQNISDEALEGEPTVTARYTLIELSGPALDEFLAAIKFSEIRPHLEAAAESGQKVARVIRYALDTLDRENRLIMIKVEDYGASGLQGPEYNSGRFMAVMRNRLDSVKGENAGGSYGLGSATMWAASQFGLVLASSNLAVAEAGRREGRFLARMELPWHQLDTDLGRRSYAGPAWYGELDPEKECTRSVWGNGALVEDAHLARADGRPGTSFLIVAAYDPSGTAGTVEEMHTAISDALAKNFWPAMVPRSGDEQGLLTAVVRSERNGQVLKEDVVDPESYFPEKAGLLRAHRADETVESLEHAGDVVRIHIPLNVPRRVGSGAQPPQEHEAVLLVTEAGEHEGGINEVAFLRGSHMIVKSASVPSVPMGSRPFHALVLVGLAAGNEPPDRAAERYLRAAEPPRHDEWEVTSEVSSAYTGAYKKALGDFFDAVRKAIREVVSRPTTDLSDGPDSLKELLRITPPNEDSTKRPKVRTASGRVDDEGRWQVNVTVSLPSRPEPWRFTPVLRFGTESGAAIPVEWELTEESKCSVDGDVVISEGGARSVRFRGRTTLDSHPISAHRATAVVDVRVHKGASA